MHHRLVVAVCLLSRCTCHGSGSADASTAVWLDADQSDVHVARSAEVEELWTRAQAADEDELERLAAREGELGLEERAAMPQYRLTALRAMAFTPSFSALPVLAAAAQRGSDEDARAAVDSADTLAARKHAQTDLEDRDELLSGCAGLLAAAKDAARPRPVRIGAVRALRMLADAYGPLCVKPVDIPTDVDAR